MNGARGSGTMQGVVPGCWGANSSAPLFVGSPYIVPADPTGPDDRETYRSPLIRRNRPTNWFPNRQ